MNLSKNFTYGEFIRSETAARNNINNNMNAEQTARAKELCETILQPLRDKVVKPLNLSSGFRSYKVNKIVHGSKASQHCKGEAADFTIPGMSVPEVCQTIIDMGLPFHQLIDEFSDNGQGWVHVSIAHKNEPPRKQFLTARKSGRSGGTVYTEINYNKP